MSCMESLFSMCRQPVFRGLKHATRRGAHRGQDLSAKAEHIEGDTVPDAAAAYAEGFFRAISRLIAEMYARAEATMMSGDVPLPV